MEAFFDIHLPFGQKQLSKILKMDQILDSQKNKREKLCVRFGNLNFYYQNPIERIIEKSGECALLEPDRSVGSKISIWFHQKFLDQKQQKSQKHNKHENVSIKNQSTSKIAKFGPKKVGNVQLFQM